MMRASIGGADVPRRRVGGIAARSSDEELDSFFPARTSEDARFAVPANRHKNVSHSPSAASASLQWAVWM
jgi:hypothetical protein